MLDRALGLAGIAIGLLTWAATALWPHLPSWVFVGGFAFGLALFSGAVGMAFNGHRFRERQLRRALETEIEELSQWLLRNVKTYECMIQLSVLGEWANHAPGLIPVHVHAEHFPEINLNLSHDERIRIDAIYNLIYQLNTDCQCIYDLTRSPTSPTILEQLQRIIHPAFANSHRALLLIHLHKCEIDVQATVDETDRLRTERDAETDATLLRLVAEARASGAAAIRRKHRDGVVSAEDLAPTPPPVPGHFYFDPTGSKLKCLAVENELISWLQLDSKVGVLTVNARFVQPLAMARHCFEITDPDERARLERLCAELPPPLRQQ